MFLQYPKLLNQCATLLLVVLKYSILLLICYYTGIIDGCLKKGWMLMVRGGFKTVLGFFSSGKSGGNKKKVRKSATECIFWHRNDDRVKRCRCVNCCDLLPHFSSDATEIVIFFNTMQLIWKKSSLIRSNSDIPSKYIYFPKIVRL